MHLVAKVFDLEISEDEVLNESKKLIGQESSMALAHALNRVIDRYLLLHQALQAGFGVTEDEFDSALLETLEDIEEAPQDDEQTRLMENRIRQRIVIRKYVEQVISHDYLIADEQLLAFYQDQEEVFFAPEAVRASHILFRLDEPEAESKARALRARIHTADDFINVCPNHSQCPSGARCGDLGWFPRGRMIKEIEDTAFALEPGQISEVFKTRYGYHILLVTDRKTRQRVPFEEIKDSLKARLIQLEKEFFLVRHVTDLRRDNQKQIQIFDPRFCL
ncbi:MAG: peptidylprolyl isomerase [Candidatus Cloacimonetes bacterium]|nr:peptidylprolyl isomerase [Candidatus Cloacimonadota bacterium]